MNSIIITGRITHDIELKTSNSGIEYANFSVAVDRRKKDKDGQKQSDFFKVSVFGKTAVFASTYFHKGDGVNVQGRMESDKYTNKDGIEMTGWTLMAENIEFPHWKGKASADGSAPEPTVLTGNDKDLPF